MSHVCDRRVETACHCSTGASLLKMKRISVHDVSAAVSFECSLRGEWFDEGGEELTISRVQISSFCAAVVITSAEDVHENDTHSS